MSYESEVSQPLLGTTSSFSISRFINQELELLRSAWKNFSNLLAKWKELRERFKTDKANAQMSKMDKIDSFLDAYVDFPLQVILGFLGNIRYLWLTTFFPLLGGLTLFGTSVAMPVFFHAMINWFILSLPTMGLYYIGFAAITVGIAIANIYLAARNDYKTKKAIDKSIHDGDDKKNSAFLTTDFLKGLNEKKIYSYKVGKTFVFIDARNEKNKKIYQVKSCDLDQAKKLVRRKISWDNNKIQIPLQLMLWFGVFGCIFCTLACVPTIAALAPWVAPALIFATGCCFTIATLSAYFLPASMLSRVFGINNIISIALLPINAGLTILSLSFAAVLGPGAVIPAAAISFISMALCMSDVVDNWKANPIISRVKLGFAVGYAALLGFSAGFMFAAPMGGIPAAIGAGAVAAIGAGIVGAVAAAFIIKHSEDINTFIKDKIVKPCKAILEKISKFKPLVNLKDGLKKFNKVGEISCDSLPAACSGSILEGSSARVRQKLGGEQRGSLDTSLPSMVDSVISGGGVNNTGRPKELLSSDRSTLGYGWGGHR